MAAARRRARAALYHRVSTREQNPRLARGELRAAAAGRGLRVVLEVEETASGRGSVRPGLDRVLDAAQRGGAIEVVLVQRLDRWGRLTLDLLANLRRLRSAGVGFVAIAQGLEVRPQHDAVSDLDAHGPRRSRRVRAGRDCRAHARWPCRCAPRRQEAGPPARQERAGARPRRRAARGRPVVDGDCASARLHGRVRPPRPSIAACRKGVRAGGIPPAPTGAGPRSRRCRNRSVSGSVDGGRRERRGRVGSRGARRLPRGGHHRGDVGEPDAAREPRQDVGEVLDRVHVRAGGS